MDFKLMLKKHKSTDYKVLNRYLAKSRNKDALKCADLIIKNNILVVPPFKESFESINKIDWINETKNSRSYLRLINGFTFLGDLVEAYDITKDKKYLDYGYIFIKEWTSSNNIENHRETMAFHDETTALRMEYLLSFYLRAVNVLSEIELEKIYLLVVETNLLLISDKFYAGKTNHGMFQDFAVLKYCLIFTEDLNVEEYICKVRSRLEEYFTSIYTIDGVHKEHSPIYHLMVTTYLKRYLNIMNDYFKDISLDYSFKKIVKNAEEYAIYITRPDGRVPNISDTVMVKLEESYPTLFTSPQYKYAISSGKYGEKPNCSDKIFKEGGYAIFRDDWSLKEKSTYILFSAAYHTGYHKHTDDLSVIIYNEGDLFVEAGANGYNYKDLYTKYGYSVYAHNTLAIRNKQLPRVDEKFDSVKIVDYNISKNKSYVSGINERYNNIVHTRKVQFDKIDNVVIVEDEVKTIEENKYLFNWHIAKDIEVISEKDEIKMYRNKQLVAKVRFECIKDFTIQIINGKTKPYIQGWFFDKMESKNPINNIEICIESDENFILKTKINLYKSIQFNQENSIKNDDLKIEGIKIDYDASKKIIESEINSESENIKYAFYVYKDNECIYKGKYIDENVFEYVPTEKGCYSILGYIKRTNSVNRKNASSKVIEID